MTLGRKIERRRKSLRLTQKGLAAASGIEQSRISKYEQDKQRPDAASIVKLAKGLQWTAGELLAGVDPSSFARRDPTRQPSAVQLPSSSQGGAGDIASSDSSGTSVQITSLETVLDVAAQLIVIGLELQQLSQTLAGGQDAGTSGAVSGRAPGAGRPGGSAARDRALQGEE